MTTPAQLIADRYQIIGSPLTGDGSLLRALDLAFGEAVALKRIVPGPAGMRVVESEVRQIQRAGEPGLVRCYGIEAQESLLVREWVHGFSLLELIRRQRELSAPVAAQLLDQLPQIIDTATRHAIQLPASLLEKVLIRFDPSVSPETVLGQPIGTWPPFSLKLNPLTQRSALSDLDAETTATTTLADPRSTAALQPPSTRFAELLYEVLGGPLRNLRERRYSPLPALREEANAVLRRALLDLPYRDCQTLWADLRKAEALNHPAPAPLAPDPATDTTPWSLTAPAPPILATAAVLKLGSSDPATPSIHLIARTHFKIGRSIQQADLLTRFLPENAVNDDLTNQLSRVHVCAELVGTDLMLRDGNGESPSVNGTTLDEEALEATPPTPLRGRALLTLGGVYSLEVIPLTTPAPPPLSIAGLDLGAPATVRKQGGAVFFLPLNRQSIPRQSVWIFSHAGFGLDATHRVIWDTRDRAGSPGVFLHEAGAFWLGNRSLQSGLVTIGGAPLAPGQIAPLAAGQQLRLGDHTFSIELI